MSVELTLGTGRWYRLVIDGQWCYGLTIDWDSSGEYYVMVLDPREKTWTKTGPMFEDLQEAAAYAAALVRLGQIIV